MARSSTRSTSGGSPRLDPSKRGGRPRRITDGAARSDRRGGRCPSRSAWGAADAWSLKRLARYLREQRDRRDLPGAPGAGSSLRAGLSFQRTRTWKASPDPDYEAKAARVIALYKQAPREGVVISFDQMGPISLRPHAGSGGPHESDPSASARRSTAATAPATSSAPMTSTLTACASGCAHADAAATTSPSCDRSAAATPSGWRIYWIQDNLSANWTPDIRAFAGPTTSSSSDADLRQLPQPRRVSLPADQRVRRQANSDYLNWDAFNYALARHVTDRNGAHRDQRSHRSKRRRQIAA